MRINEVMTNGVVWTYPDATLQEAAAKMKSAGVGLLPIRDRDQIVGVVTDRDITVRATAEGKNPFMTQVREVMTRGVIYCFEDQLIVEAAMLMQENQVRRLIVLNQDNQPVGIVSLGDLAVETGDEDLAEITLEAVSGRNLLRSR